MAPQKLRESESSRLFSVMQYQFLRASIPFIPCSAGLSPRAGSCMREGALLQFETHGGVVYRLYCLALQAFRGLRTALVVPALQSLFPLLPGPCSFVRLSDKWKRVVPW